MATPIRKALTEESRLRSLVKDGIQAIEPAHRGLLDDEIRPLFADSLDLDKVFQEGHDQENRWDYLLGHKDSRKLIGLEPHSASTSEISTVIRKREASMRHLRGHFKPGIFVDQWFWVASGKVDFVPMEKAINRLNQNGIRFVGKQLLRKWLPNSAASLSAQPAVMEKAVLGKVAPEFMLQDLGGNEVKLSSFRGKPVVLEWFNPSCPVVKKIHNTGALVSAAQRHSRDGVAWLAINSTGSGKAGAKPKENATATKKWAIEYPILRDASGSVGRTYGATHTPHIFVIDKNGVLVYVGALDNEPDVVAGSATLINYIDAALKDIGEGNPVTTATSKVYGSLIKYASRVDDNPRAK